MPLDILENVNEVGDTDEECGKRDQGYHMHEPPLHHSPHVLVSSTHTKPYFSDTFAGTSIGAAHITLDDVLRKVKARNAGDAEHDSLISTMHR